MKDFFKFFGIIALIAVIGFSMAGCKNDDDGDSDDDVTFTVQETSGRLTINGLSSYNGKYVIAQAFEPALVAAAQIDRQAKGGIVANGNVTLKVWKGSGSSAEGFNNYTGNDKDVAFIVYISNSDTSLAGSGTVTVGFTNGVGTGSFTAAFTSP